MRCALLLVLLCVACPAPKPTTPSLPEDSKLTWLKENASSLRTIQPGDPDRSDLAALRAFVGDARIVMLGERSHGDAATLTAKLRLVELLHQEMGIEVLAFEAGLYDCRRAFTQLLSGESPEEATRACFYGRISGSEEAKALSDYVARAARSTKPLTLAGFDCQITDKQVKTRTADAVGAFLVKTDPSLATTPRLASIVEAIGKLRDYDRVRTSEEREKDRAALAELATLVNGAAAKLYPEEAAFFGQLAKSLAIQEQGNWDYQTLGDVDIAQINLRDAQMADNLIWLAEKQYPQKKIIVWAATYHIMRNADRITPVDSNSKGMGAMLSGLLPMGQLVKAHFQEAAIALGFITARGKSSCCEKESTQGLTPAPPSSLEGLLERAGFRYALLDLRKGTEQGAWLQEKLLGRPQAHEFFLTEWPKILDGVVFIQEMTTLTKVP